MADTKKCRGIEEVFRLFQEHGQGNYIGEALSKTEHSLQCAMLSEKEGWGTEVILGAFLHDIGHLVGIDRNLERMVTNGVDLGAKDHDVVGENFLKEFGFPAAITDFVRGHVQAKRYLVFKHPEYHNGLSDASKNTLVHQGGPMTATEAETFEQLPSFSAILRMRKWDELAKDPSCETEPIEKYRTMCYDYWSDIKELNK